MKLHALSALVLVAAGTARADVVTLEPDRDASLYAESGDLANGAGTGLFAGANGNGSARRALVRFDVASALPPGATVRSVTLTLTVTMTQINAQPLELFRVERDWSEAGSVPVGNGGAGAFALAGDATWTHASWPDTTWSAPGGDLATLASASAPAGFGGSEVVWSGPGPAADVRGWIDAPASNFGWAIRHANEQPASTAKRLASREHPVASERPRLRIEFDAAPPACATTNTCLALPNSTGAPATMSVSGSCSIAAGGVTFRAQPVPDTLFFFMQGRSSAQLPFGDGFLCIGAGLRRILPTPVATGSVAELTFDPVALGIAFPGVRHVQCWYRDPAAGGAGFNTSDAIAITFTP